MLFIRGYASLSVLFGCVLVCGYWGYGGLCFVIISLRGGLYWGGWGVFERGKGVGVGGHGILINVVVSFVAYKVFNFC